MRWQQLWIVGALAISAGCGPSQPPSSRPAATSHVRYHGGDAPLSRAADRVMREIPAGYYIAGSTREERSIAYADYERTAGHDTARRGKWFNREQTRQRRTLPRYRVDLSPVTNAAFAEFVADTRRTPPRIDAKRWAAQRFAQNYEKHVKRYNWSHEGPPPSRADHPVLLVTWQDAADYCIWRGNVIGNPRRLPSAAEYEKAARGAHGLVYPWGNDWDKTRLKGAETAPDDTVSVGGYPKGASPFGVLGMAGNVFHWTSTPWQNKPGIMTVKGSAWEDYAGVGRGAAQHGRKVTIRHAIVGFRCASD